MRGENRKHLHVVRREIVELRTFEVHHADHAVLENHGHGELRARLGIHHAVARIERHVRNHHGTPQRSRRADDAFVLGDGGFFLHTLAEFHGHVMAKDGSTLVVEQDAENLVVDQPLGQFRRAAQHLFHLQRGIRFAPDFVQQQQRLGLLLRALEEPRVLDGRADAAGDQRENGLLRAA